jgi:CMP-N-acetylneuraminic acid synthetase
MFRGKPVLAVIPARAWSKGLPGKNLLKIGEQTLIELAAKAAFDSGLVDFVLVSSEDPEILKHAEGIKDVVAHPRNELAANETSTAGDVIRDLLDSDHDDVFIDEGNAPWFVYLQASSPLRSGKDVQGAFEILAENPQAEAVVSVTADNRFAPNGAIYIFTLEEFKKTGTLPVDGAAHYVMSSEDSLQINTMADYQEALARFS